MRSQRECRYRPSADHTGGAGELGVTGEVPLEVSGTPDVTSDEEVGSLEVFCEVDLYGVEVGDVYRLKS